MTRLGWINQLPSLFISSCEPVHHHHCHKTPDLKVQSPIARLRRLTHYLFMQKKSDFLNPNWNCSQGGVCLNAWDISHRWLEGLQLLKFWEKKKSKFVWLCCTYANEIRWTGEFLARSRPSSGGAEALEPRQAASYSPAFCCRGTIRNMLSWCWARAHWLMLIHLHWPPIRRVVRGAVTAGRLD